jgi:hypothetical protein
VYIVCTTRRTTAVLTGLAADVASPLVVEASR